MQARNHRYNQTAAFSLSAAQQEIERDLTAVMDDRYLVNYVEVKRAETDDLLGTLKRGLHGRVRHL